MAREPDVAVYKTAPGSLARRQILAGFLQSVAKQRIPPERLSKVNISAVLSCHKARLAKLVSNWKVWWPHTAPMLNCMALKEKHF